MCEVVKKQSCHNNIKLHGFKFFGENIKHLELRILQWDVFARIPYYIWIRIDADQFNGDFVLFGPLINKVQHIAAATTEAAHDIDVP